MWGSIPGPVQSDTVVNGSPPLGHLFGILLPGFKPRMSPATCCTLRRKILSMMKTFIIVAAPAITDLRLAERYE